jgi:hypothetical protein
MPRTTAIPIVLLDPARVRPVPVPNPAKRGMTAGLQAQAIRYVAACLPDILGLLATRIAHVRARAHTSSAAYGGHY